MNPWLISAPVTIAAVSGITAYGAAYPRAQLFGRTICRTDSPRKLAITFDDGPNPAITPKLLDLLDRYNARATFFVIGRFVRECPALVKETAARGHEVGNHTELHPNLFWLNPTKVRVELRLCHDAIHHAIGTPPKWFRPPYGFRNPWVIPLARELDYRTVMWTLIPGDWREKPTEWLIERMKPIEQHAKKAPPVMAQEKADLTPPFPRQGLAPANRGQVRDRVRDDNPVEPAGRIPAAQARVPVLQGGGGDILCLHDGYHKELNYDRTRTLAALEHWLPRWRDLGLEFVTIDEAVR